MTRTFLAAGRLRGPATLAAATAAVLTLAAGAMPSSASAGPARATVGTIATVSRCSGQNAEVEQAVDPMRGYVYEEWMGCGNRIGFARSTDGGRHFGAPVVLAKSKGAWDPALAVAPDGSVYAAFMNGTKHHTFPVVEKSFNRGRTFPQVRKLVPKQRGNWGDRDFIAVGPAGTVYLTWDYGPSAKAVKFICSPNGSCAFSRGDLNVVMQKSANGGRTWGKIVPISPGFPASGGDSAPLVVEPSGRIDVLYQGYRITSRKTYAMTPAHSYFTASGNGGRTWSHPVRVGPTGLTMSLAEWWIDGDITSDAAGNLYATWDSQGAKRDIGWLSYSTNHGRTWSPLQRVTPDNTKATHIVQVAGGRPGVAYVGWLADNSRRGYAEYIRPFAIGHGWLSGPVQVSRRYGSSKVWPGDTFGISVLDHGRIRSGHGPEKLALSWGSAVRRGKHPNSEIFSALVRFR